VSSVLFENSHKYVKDIIESLKRECAFQREYLRLIEAEKIALQKLKSPTIDDCTSKRDALVTKIKKEQDLRIDILKVILKQITGERPELKLTAIAERVFHQKDSEEIKQHCGILKQLIEISQKKTKELETMVAFSMKLVSGSISTILSHTQKERPIYNSYGKIPESESPSGVRHIMSRTA
jgi:hypothetical protein